MRRLALYASLPAATRVRYLKAALLLATVRAALWVVPFRWLCSALERATRRASASDGDPAAVAAEAEAVRTVARYIPGATCLTQALALMTLLRLLGQPADLRIGVRKNGGALEAHAWVESQGHIIIGKIRGLARYTVLTSRGNPTLL